MQRNRSLVIGLVLMGLMAYLLTARAATIQRQSTNKRPLKKEVDLSARPAASRTKKGVKSTPRRYRKRPARRPGGRSWAGPAAVDNTAGDLVDGEDLTVRQAAVSALGSLYGSVVVADPNTGRILSMVNQKLALASGFTPCSTIKVPVALAALNEGIISQHTKLRLGGQWYMDLTNALAVSNNVFFARLGEGLGFDRFRRYARLFGFGEKAGWNIPGEQLGVFPEAPPKNGGVGRLTSFGEEISATPLQQAAFVSAIANGGTLYYLQCPRTPEEIAQFVPKVKRRLDIAAWIPSVLPGMTAAVERGTARRAYDPQDPIMGKTGTCSQEGLRLGWFTSYNGLGNKLAVVVLLRGGRTFGPLAAEVAGRVYKNLTGKNYFANRRELDPAAFVAGDSCCYR